MTSARDKPKRWGPKFSVRTLVIIMTLVCCYAACWGPTKRQGVDDCRRYVDRKAIEFGNDLAREWLYVYSWEARATAPVRVHHIDDKRRYYFWLFGYVAKLPYEGEAPSADSMP